MNPFRSALTLIACVIFLTPAGAADAPAPPQKLQIVLANFNFTPNMIRLQRNTPYTIHLMNTASGGHSFSAPAFFSAVTVAPEDSAKITGGKVEVPAGQAVDITVTPVTPGNYPIICSHFLHSGFGMRGQAVIE